MGRTVERIDRELVELDQAIIQLGDDLFTTYQNYLKIFGKALQKQFILAAHHICTQVYPQPFLQLSYSQRQNLQQKLMEAVKHTHQDLLSSLSHPYQEENPAVLPPNYPESPDSSRASADPEQNAGSDINLEKSVAIANPLLELLTSRSEHSQGLAQRQAKVYHLMHWLEQQERGIVEQLRQLSWDANRLLQQNKVLPPKVPESLLEMTVKADLLNEAPSGVPNILDITLDAIKAPEDLTDERERSEASDYREPDQDYPDQPESSRDHSPNKGHPSAFNSLEEFLPLLKKLPIRFVALHLNLTDIEFADPNTATHRSQIRQLAAKLNQAEKIYRKKQQERAIVAAEDAWQASWFES